MKTPSVVTRTPARTRLSALSKLTAAAVIGFPLLLSTDFFVHGVNASNLLITGIALIIAAIISGIIVTTRWRWSPLLGVLVYGLVVAGSIPFILNALSLPNETYMFALNVVLLALSVIAIGAGIGATVQNYRSGKGEHQHNTPRWLGVSVSGLAGIAAGMLIVSLIIAANPQSSAASATSNGEPVVYLAADHFVQNVVLVPKGSKLLIVDDGSIEHVLQNGMWDMNGTPHPAVELGALVIRNVDITGGSREIGPFPIAGVYHLYCTLHQGMNLTIVVQ
jgi:hypothetical protein